MIESVQPDDTIFSIVDMRTGGDFPEEVLRITPGSYLRAGTVITFRGETWEVPWDIGSPVTHTAMANEVDSPERRSDA